jgi:asparagine synthase (glutamine-hydrolysing)
MCGISGVVYKTPQNSINDLVLMNNTIKHRGPDDEGFVVFSNEQIIVAGGADTNESSWNQNTNYQPLSRIENIDTTSISVGLGHRRLSILDLSPFGHQPMCDSAKRYWIAFNGEIYNYIEIRRELIQLGYEFFTNTDTEVIIAAFDCWGLECQHKFNGMWAFSIYDRKKQQLFFSRDRFGIKPLYYWFSPKGDFYFGSEIKQFTILSEWRAVLNHQRAIDYLYHSLTDHTDETMFQGVFSILPGHCVLLNTDEFLKSKTKLYLQRWYDPSISKFDRSFEEAKAVFLQRFKDSITLHLRADVKVGSALSGGLDSSSLVSYINILLNEQGKADLQTTFSSCAEDKRFDERIWMEEVVNAIKVEANYIYPKGANVFNLTEKLIWHMDEPYQSQSAYLGYHVFEEAKKKGVVVLLNGQGADEYLSGYGEFKIIRLKSLLLHLKFRRLFNEIDGFRHFIRLIFGVILDILPQNILVKINNRRKKSVLDNIVNLEKFNKSDKSFEEIYNLRRRSTIEVSNYQLFSDPLPRYLRWEDRNSMANSVEARVPFLDYRLVEFTQSLPLNYLDAYNQSKRILVESMEGILPDKVRKRADKKGFITPEEYWLKEEFKDDFIQMLNKYHNYSKGLINLDEALKYLQKVQTCKMPFNYTYWRIILFCVWMKVFKVELH